MYKTSAKTGHNVKVAISCLVREVLKEGSYIDRQEIDNRSALTAMYRSSIYQTVNNKIETDLSVNKNSIRLSKRFHGDINAAKSHDKACCKNGCF